ncbi:MAG: YlbF family regulator [Coprococcus eutactus]
MTDTLELSRQLNACIKDSEVYKNYQYCKAQDSEQKPDRLQQLMEFRKKIMLMQNNEMLDNPYDEVNNLFIEYDSVVHDNGKRFYQRRSRKLVRMMKMVYEQIADDLDFDIIDEDAQ